MIFAIYYYPDSQEPGPCDFYILESFDNPNVEELAFDLEVWEAAQLVGMGN